MIERAQLANDLAQSVALNAAMKQVADAAIAAVSLGPDRPESTLSWAGFNVHGDAASIKAVRDALHDAGTVPELKARIAEANQPAQGVAFADGENPCVLEWGAVSLPMGDPSRVTNLQLFPTLWAAIAEGALCGFDWRVYPMAAQPDAALAQAPAAEPLTDEQIQAIGLEMPTGEQVGWLLRFARTIERAHGIGAA
jgi:hypothetical protein